MPWMHVWAATALSTILAVKCVGCRDSTAVMVGQSPRESSGIGKQGPREH